VGPQDRGEIRGSTLKYQLIREISLRARYLCLAADADGLASLVGPVSVQKDV